MAHDVLRCAAVFLLHAAALVALFGGLAGCSALPAKKTRADAKLDRPLRREKAIAEFEHKRDDAQFAAALDRADQGDVQDAENLLANLLQRNPDHSDARLLLADLWAAQDRTEDAERQLRTLIEREPENARAHYSLALLLDVSGRSGEAAEHFRRAADLAPDRNF